MSKHHQGGADWKEIIASGRGRKGRPSSAPKPGRDAQAYGKPEGKPKRRPGATVFDRPVT